MQTAGQFGEARGSVLTLPPKSWRGWKVAWIYSIDAPVTCKAGQAIRGAAA